MLQDVLANQYVQTLAILRNATAMPCAGLFDRRVVLRAVLFKAGLVAGADLNNQFLVMLPCCAIVASCA